MEDENARSQALAQLASIREMVEALIKAREDEDDDAYEDAERSIHEDALSVEVRSCWYIPGSTDRYPDEYRIMLCTGGPAVQIRGDLDQGSPSTARLECQDWFKPWTDVDITPEDRKALIEYASCFYFGE